MSQEEQTPEQLQQVLAEQKANSNKLQQQVESMKIRNDIEAEKMQQQQWELALQELQNTREEIAKQHEENLTRIRDMAHSKATPVCPAASWLQEQLTTQATEPPRPNADPDMERKQNMIQDLQKQQQELQHQIEDIMGTTQPATESRDKPEQALLLEQIRAALAPKETTKDPNRALLKALITSQNKTAGCSGTSTLKPDMASKLMGEGEFSMAEWLASLNKQDEGESEVGRLVNKIDDNYDCRTKCRHAKTRSGVLDKSSTNIRHKEVWPQKNLGEDLAEEEVEFKQL